MTHDAADTARPAGLHTAAVTGAQILSFADLVRRLSSAEHAGDGGRGLRRDYIDALSEFLGLTPEPSGDDRDAYLRAMKAGEVPNWGMDDRPLFCATAEWAAQVRAAGAPRAAWPGLCAAGAAAYEMTVTAGQIFNFGTLVSRLGRHDYPLDEDVRLRHDAWAGLQAFLELLPDPDDDDVDSYLDAVRAGELPDWNAGGRPLTEATAARAGRGRARPAAEESAAAE